MFGLFGYTNEDECIVCLPFDTEKEARYALLNYKNLAYLEIWKADEDGLFGVCGEPILHREF